MGRDDGARRKLTGPRTAAFVVAAVLAVYLVLMAGRAVTMIVSGNPVFVGLGLAILVFPVLGALLRKIDTTRFARTGICVPMRHR